ncbi:unnamed protein product [Cylicostephanus goldi]|uniref:Uncharacterized protein n=1 Tax=Cylicostephanus goldi TaxID=71465 RepID=A0A3P6RP52_CYLGO|nr:unnamed protein product [Cylicostephanus goldi]
MLLSISQLILMPSTLKWPGKNEYSVVVTSNPALQQGPRELCQVLFEFLYFRQWEATVLSICIVPVNRAISVCWKHMAPTNAKIWIFIALLPNLLPLLVTVFCHHLGMTHFEDVATFPARAIDLLVNQVNAEKYCTLKSNYRKAGDIVTTGFLIFCPIISYVITIVRKYYVKLAIVLNIDFYS